jgi:hypothetical protein
MANFAKKIFTATLLSKLPHFCFAKRQSVAVTFSFKIKHLQRFFSKIATLWSKISKSIRYSHFSFLFLKNKIIRKVWKVWQFFNKNAVSL